MAKVVLLSLIVLLFASLTFASCSSSSTLSVFEPGEYSTISFPVKQSQTKNSPPKPLRIVSPSNVHGSFPVILFLHGTCLQNSDYSQLVTHIASHGYIVVAPQLYTCGLIPPVCTGFKELDDAASVVNWLPSGLQSVISTSAAAGVVADLNNNFFIAGHSRGAKQAFALALGKVPLQLKFSALLAIDPVAGMSEYCFTEPKILGFRKNSLNLNIPVTIIGTGLGNQSKALLRCPCAPNKVNHVEFFLESNAPKGHFVAKEYGHLDMLDDGRPPLPTGNICKASKLSRNDFRRTAGGITVAFLEYIIDSSSDDYMRIVQEPKLAPVKLETPVFISETQHQVAIEDDDTYVKLQLSNEHHIPVETMLQTVEGCDQEIACTMGSVLMCFVPLSTNEDL